jgi:hypothetical protein
MEGSIMPQVRFANELDYMSRVALGIAPGHSPFSGLGERTSMGTTAAGEDIWRGNELTPAPTSHVKIPTPSMSGEQMTVVSEDANDTLLGTGARTVMIHYLDANGVQQRETLEMAGLTPVNTVATDIIFVNDFHVVSNGTGLVTAGHLKIYKTGTVGLVYNMIAAGGNKSLVPHKMVPGGHSLVVKWWHATEAKNKRCAFRLRSTNNYLNLTPNTFLFKDTAYLNGVASGSLNVNFACPEYAIIKVTGWPDAAGSEGSCSWHGFIVENK